jgi:acyl carrier protein
VVAAIAKRLNSNVVFIQTESSGKNHFMRIPLTGAITRTIVGTSPNSETRQVQLSYVGPRLVVDIDTHGGIGLVVAIKVSSFPLVAYLHKANDTDAAEWDRVKYEPSDELDTAEYVANLDSALSGAARGDFETAIGGLEKAYGHAPPGPEHARDRALLGTVASQLLDGSIGETQSLSYMFQAFSNWPPAKSRKGNVIDSTELSSGVDRWLYDTLKWTFFYHQKEYPQIAKAFGFHDLPSTVDVLVLSGDHARWVDATSGPNNGGERSIVSVDADSLVNLARLNQSTASFQQRLDKEFGASSEIRRWAAEVLVDQEDFSNPNLDSATSWLVDQLSEPSRTQYNNYRQSLQLLWSASRNPAPTSEELINAYQQIAEKYDFSQLALTFKALKEGSDFPKGSKFAFTQTGPVPDAPWWDRRFLGWFTAKSIALSQDLNDLSDECPSPSCKECLESAAHEFQEYQAERKINFAPGRALVLSAAQIFEQPPVNDWRESYRDAMGAEFVGLDLGGNPAQPKQPSPKHDEIAAKVERIIVEQLGLDESAVRESARFTQDLRLNSNDVVELILAWEEAFNIEISDDEASKLVKVNDAINCVKKHLRQAKRPIRNPL